MEKFTRGGFGNGGDRGGSKGSFRNGGGKGGFKGGFRGGYKGGSGSADRGNRPMIMHSAICASCNKPCEVPFRPTDGKAVYCRDCFAGRSAMGGERSERKDFRSNSNNFSHPSHSNTSNNSFQNQSKGGGNDDMKKQLEMVNNKLEKLINSVENLARVINKGKTEAVAPKVFEKVKAVEEKSPEIKEKKVATKKVDKK